MAGSGRQRSRPAKGGERPIAAEAPWRERRFTHCVSLPLAARSSLRRAGRRDALATGVGRGPRGVRDARLHPSGRRRAGAGKGGKKRLRRRAPALEAGSVARGERGRLVEKEELRVASPPNLTLAVLERADADDPAPRRPPSAGQRPIVPMDPPASVAHQPAALGDGMKFAERVDAILQRSARLGHVWVAEAEGVR